MLERMWVPTLGLEACFDLLGPFWRQILAMWKPPGRRWNAPSRTIGKRPVFGHVLAGSVLAPDFGNLAASEPQLKPPSGTIGKRPFWAKSWPGALWSQILAIWKPLESFWEAPGQLLATSRKPPCPCVKRAAARSKIFPVGRVEPDAVFGYFEALVCFSEASNVVLAAWNL